MLKRLLKLLLLVLLANNAFAQIAVVDSQTAIQLVQKLTGTGVTISNAVLTCPGKANGIFTTTSSNLNLGEGIILTAGASMDAVGPASFFASSSNNAPGDAALTTLINATTYDACVLEFDFLPIGDTVKFRYVFGSEEYPGYACTQFNDVFGFFISGPGFSSTTNIAKIPNTNIPVSINSTAGVVGTSGGMLSTCQAMGTGSPFTQYYVNNSSGTTVTYNGFTSILTATAIVIPCSTYHLKLAIADAIDHSFDSGVFLEAGSFSSNVISISTATNNIQAPVPYCVRGCKNGSFTFKRQKVTALPLTIKYQIGGSAVNGTDYTTIPDSVIIPANDSVVTGTIVPLTTASGTKTIKLYVFSPFNCGQSQAVFDSSEITIYDSIYAHISAPDTGVCPGGSLQIKPVGDDILQYRWSPATWLNDTTLKNPTTTPASAITYTLKATLPASTCAPVYDQVNVSIYAPPQVSTEPVNKSICDGTNGSFSVAATGHGLTYQWQVKSSTVFSNISNNSIYSGATANTLVLSNVIPGMNGYQYRCVVSGTCLPRDTSVTTTLTITYPPAVTASPNNRTICDGDTASFTVAATGADLTYKWQENTGSGYADLTASSIYSGVTTNKLMITGSLYSMNGYFYRCVLSGSCSPPANSNDALLTVNKTPEVTQPPANTATCPDSPASFSVTAVATDITYQWQVSTGGSFTNIANNSTYSGATDPLLNISSAPTSMQGYTYRCIISGSCNPPDTSAAATLQIHATPAVAVQPKDTIVCAGNNASFTISATGAGPVYQWQLNDGGGFFDLINDIVYSGTSTGQLTITDATSNMSNYRYRCIVSGTCLPPDTSEDKTLTVNILPAILLQPKDSTLCENDTATFSITAIGTSLHYQWQVNPGNGFSNLANGGVYSNVTTSTLKLSGVPASMNNYQYRCIVSGACTPNDTSFSKLLAVNIRPVVVTPCHDTTVCDGLAAAFNVSAAGTGIAYQWQVDDGTGFANITNNATYSGATSGNLAISGTTPAMHGYQYRCTITGVCDPSVTTSPAALFINTLPNLSSDPADKVICEQDNTSFSITATGTALIYQWQANNGSGFADITDNSVYSGTHAGTLQLTSANAGLNGYYYRCIVSGTCTPPDTSERAMLTVHIRPAVTLQAHDSTVCDGGNASFIIQAVGTNASYQWQLNDGSGFIDISNNTTYSGTTTNTLNVFAAGLPMSNYQYRCNVSGICTPIANSQPVLLHVDTLPVIIAQPIDTIICDGDNVAFGITAIGSGLHYQWQVNAGGGFVNVGNSSLYSGAATNVLTLTSAGTSLDGYYYRCLVTGNCLPRDTSLQALLTVHYLPTITSEPHDSTVCEGQDVLYSISATGTAISYQWQVNAGSGYTDLSNDLMYSGVNGDSLHLTAATAAMSNNLYRCIVSGACDPDDTSFAASLTVHILPGITLQAHDTFVCNGSDAGFAINAVGTGISYQWQVDNGGGFINISNNSTYNNAQSDALAIASASASMDSFRYRCIIQGVCTPPDTSVIAVLRVGTPPSVVAAPIATQICEGGDALFTISATGTLLTYQWQVNTSNGYINIIDGGVYSGANTTNLLLTGVTSAMTGYLYQCIVTGACPPAVTSGSLTLSLTVFTKPSVTLSPESKKICAGQNTNFSAAGTGTDINYQWQVDAGAGFQNLSDNAIYNGSNNTTLNITAADKSMSGNVYRCVIIGVCLPDAITQSSVLTVDTLPAVMIQPLDTTVCEQTPASFAIKSEGTQRAIQWQMNTGTGFTNLPNAGIYSGANTDTLLIANTTLSMNNYQYRCIINGFCSPPDTSDIAILSTDTIPVITQQPLNDTVCEGDPAQYTVTAVGTDIHYQWQVNAGTGFANISNNSMYSGAATAMLDVSGTTYAMDAYEYRCIVSGECSPPDTSSHVTLTVFTRPLITSEPEDSTVCEGNQVIFAITATGTGLIYQWQENSGTGFSNLSNGGIYAGATADTLTINPTTFSMNNYEYRCILSGTCTPPDTSMIAKLTVDLLPDISMQPHDSTICEGQNAAFEISATGTTITYQWQVNTGSGSFTNVVNSSMYSGAATDILSLTAGTAAMNNYMYRCIVSGVCTPPDTSLQAKLTVNTLPDITTQPHDSTICENNDATFALAATGTALSYQWQVDLGLGFVDVNNNSIYNGATADTLHISAADISMNGYFYRCIVSGICLPPDTSVAAKLNIHTPPVITTQPVNTIVCEADTTTLAVAATGTTLSYQWQIDAGSGFVNVANSGQYAGALSNFLSITGATTAMNGDKFRCIVSGVCPPPDTSAIVILSVYTAPAIVSQPRDTSICPDVATWFKLTSTGSVLTYQWQLNTGSGFGNITNNATYSGSTTNQLKLTAAAASFDGYKYRCIVSGYCTPADTSDEATLTIYPRPEPEIVPEDPTTACNGDTVVLTGLPASGVTYQWQLNNTDIPGAADAMLYATESGSYTLVVATEHCDAISAPLQLVFNPRPDPALNIPDNPIVCEDSSVLITVRWPEAGYIYQWKIDQQPILGADRDFFKIAQRGTYHVVITNSFGCTVTSELITVDEDDSPAPYIDAQNIFLCTQLFDKYQWYRNKSMIPAATQDCYTALENGLYQVQIVNNKGCIRMTEGYQIDRTSVIWPNPTAGIVNVLSAMPATLKLTDQDGKLILTSEFNAKQIDISHVADGVYMLTLFDSYGNAFASERIVKVSR